MSKVDRSAEKTAAIRGRLHGVRHALFGLIVATATPDAPVFNPLPMFYDPGKLAQVLAFFRLRAARAGIGSGLPARLRRAAVEEAAQRGLSYFMDRDYRAAGFTADEGCRALLSAARYMDRCRWTARDGSQDRDHRRNRGPGNAALWNRAQRSRAGYSPAAIYAAARGTAEDTAALLGHGCDDRPGRAKAIPGGPSGRGLTDGRMMYETIQTRDRVEHLPRMPGLETLFQETETVTRWKMIRGRGRAETLPPCVVITGRPEPRRRFVPQPVPRPIPADPADGTYRGIHHDAAAVAELARERMTPGTDARADWLASREPEVGDWRDALARRVAMFTAREE